MKDSREWKENPSIENQEDTHEVLNKCLILHNDEVNSFEYVIESLVEVCEHDAVQAEQCAYITHFKGKCDVRLGDIDILKPMKNELIRRGLTATIN